MMSAEILKNKNPNYNFAIRAVKQAIKMNTTLSDRLKQAGIKGSNPKSRAKRGKNKNSKKKKTDFKKSYSEDYMSNCFQRNKKLRKPLKHYVTPYENKSLEDNEVRGKLISNESEENNPENSAINEKETIFVSLDFIEDCQNYKKKVRKPKQGRPLRSYRKSVRSISSSQKTEKKTSSRKSTDSNSADKSECQENITEENEETKERKENVFIEVEINNKSEMEKEFAESLQNLRAFLKKKSSESIAKIDRKYLESLFSFTKNEENTIKKESGEKIEQNEESEFENQNEKKKKITGRDFFERKMRNDALKNLEDGRRTRTELKEGSCAGAMSPRMVRDLTKSEEQIKLKKGKNLFDSQNNSAIKNKNVTHSKPDINDINRKKRKQRNKFMKNNAEEFIEKSLPSEVSKVADVKELWRRNTLLKKSENSLTSQSSCTVPETDEYPGSRNLDSYKMLKKLVEEEINNISKSGKTKKENNSTPEDPKQSEQSKIQEQTPPLLETSNREKLNTLPILKRRLLQAQYEGKMRKPEVLNILAEDIPKEANPKLQKLQEKAKEGAKIPCKAIENWSILNRLEQAFIGLGTPTFPDKSLKNENGLKSKLTNGNNTANQKTQPVKDSRKIPKCKEVLGSPQKPAHQILASPKNKVAICGRTVKPTESSSRINATMEKRQVSKSRKNPEKEINLAKVSNGDKNESKPKKKKRPSHPNMSLTKKISLNSVSRYPGREPHEVQFNIYSSSRTRLRVKSKRQKMVKNKSSNTILQSSNQKKNSKENLERKKTFDVIPMTDESIIHPRKSKSCDINEVTVEGRFSQTISQETKQCDCFLDKLTDENGRSACDQAATCDQPSQLEYSLEQKDCWNGSRGTFTVLRERNDQEEESEKSSQCIPSGSETTNSHDSYSSNMDTDVGDNKSSEVKNDSSTFKERVVKKRSFLSVHVDQHCDQAPRTLLQITEDSASLIGKASNNSRDLKKSCSNASVTSTTTYELVEKRVQNYFINPKTQAKPEMSPRQALSSINNSDFSADENEIEHDESDTRSGRQQPLWEQDISHYRAIVKDIMNQYKRIDGFLKQNEHLTALTNDSASLMTVNNSDSGKSYSSYDSRIMSIKEYRKKIASEYEELPILEYKKKLQNSEGSCQPESSRKRDLLVVRNLRADVDLDVKDYEPNIQNVLDSQLYVGTERRVKRNEYNVKFKEKTSSLQEIVLCNNEKPARNEDWQKSCSTPKQFPPERSHDIPTSGQMLSSQTNSLYYVTSESTTGYCQEFESEGCQEGR